MKKLLSVVLVLVILLSSNLAGCRWLYDDVPISSGFSYTSGSMSNLYTDENSSEVEEHSGIILEGLIFDINKKILKDVVVSVSSTKNESITNSKGEYHIEEIKLGTRSITVKSKKGDTLGSVAVTIKQGNSCKLEENELTVTGDGAVVNIYIKEGGKLTMSLNLEAEAPKYPERTKPSESTKVINSSKNESEVVKDEEMYGWLNNNVKYSGFVRQGSKGRANATTGLTYSQDWKVSLNGEEYPVLATPVVNGGAHSFVSIPYRSGSDKIELVSLRRNITSFTISPLSLGIKGTKSDKTISFIPPREGNFVIQINDGYDYPITVSYFKEDPVPTTPNVRFFAKGRHEINRLSIKSDEIIYLETGAVLEATTPTEKPTTTSDWAGQKTYSPFIQAWFANNVTIMGNGIIDTSGLAWHARSPMSFTLCKNLTISGATIVGAGSWNLILDRCDGVNIKNVRIYGYRENSDGIDIVSSQNVTVDNTFVHTGDDAIVVKAMQKPPTVGGKNITVKRCSVWNDNVRCFGITAETKNDISDVTFTDCDVIRSFADWTWELGSLAIIVCDNGVISNTVFDNIRIEHEEHAIFCAGIVKDQWSQTEEAGKINKVTLRNITAPGGVPIIIKGYNDTHRISGVDFKNLKINGKVITSESQVNLQKNNYVDGIKFTN